MFRDLWHAADTAARAAGAIVAGVLPRRYWPELDRVVPVHRAAFASALATIALAGIIGVPAFFRHAEANAGLATDLTLEVAGWRTPSGASAPSDTAARAAWGASYLSLLTFAMSPIGLLTLYLGITGGVRAVAVATDDARGDPVLTLVDAAAARLWRQAQTRRTRLARERLEGPAVPDRLLTGPAAGFPDADCVVVASRRKPGWDPGVFVITSEQWYRLGTPVERQTPAGLRTLYPLTELRDHEALRRGVPYELPPLGGAPPTSRRHESG